MYNPGVADEIVKAHVGFIAEIGKAARRFSKIANQVMRLEQLHSLLPPHFAAEKSAIRKFISSQKIPGHTESIFSSFDLVVVFKINYFDLKRQIAQNGKAIVKLIQEQKNGLNGSSAQELEKLESQISKWSLKVSPASLTEHPQLESGGNEEATEAAPDLACAFTASVLAHLEFVKDVNKLANRLSKVANLILLLKKLDELLPHRRFSQIKSAIQRTIFLPSLASYGDSIVQAIRRIGTFLSRYLELKQNLVLNAQSMLLGIQEERSLLSKGEEEWISIEKKLIKWSSRAEQIVIRDDLIEESVHAFSASSLGKRKRVEGGRNSSKGNRSGESSEHLSKRREITDLKADQASKGSSENAIVSRTVHEIGKIIPQNNELVLVTPPEIVPSYLTSYVWGGREPPLYFSDKFSPILDAAVNEKYCAYIVQGKVFVRGSSPNGRLALDERPALGSIDITYYPLCAYPEKIDLMGTDLAIAYRDGKVIIVSLVQWEALQKEELEKWGAQKGKEKELELWRLAQFSKICQTLPSNCLCVDPKKQYRRKDYYFSNPITAMVSNQSYLALGSSSKVTGIFHLGNKTLRSFGGHRFGVVAIALKENTLYSGAKNGKMNVWDLATNNLLFTKEWGAEITHLESDAAGVFVLVSHGLAESRLYYVCRTTAVVTELFLTQGGNKKWQLVNELPKAPVQCIQSMHLREDVPGSYTLFMATYNKELHTYQYKM